MPISAEFLTKLACTPPEVAWRHIFDYCWEIFSQPVKSSNAAEEVTRRDRLIAPIDLFLATAGWDLWQKYEGSVERTAPSLVSWWESEQNQGGLAVLILDALSLREIPWIIHQATALGYKVNGRPTGAELPGDTRSFSRALGFSQRSSLENNAAGKNHKLANATTDSTDNPWTECTKRIEAEPNWILWHHWPDNLLHDLAKQSGHGLNDFTKEVAESLRSADFWALVERLTTGRKLLITSDHGYAASGLFPDVSDKQQALYLKDLFGSKRYDVSNKDTNDQCWTPPIELQLETAHGSNRMVLGRRKWKSPGGYPSLSHGGLSVL